MFFNKVGEILLFRKLLLLIFTFFFLTSIYSQKRWCGIWKYATLNSQNDSIIFQGIYPYDESKENIHNIDQVKLDGYWLIGFAEDSGKILTYIPAIKKLFDIGKKSLINYQFSTNFQQFEWETFKNFPNGRWLEFIKRGTLHFTQVEIQKDNDLQGEIMTYYSKETLYSKYTYYNGLLNGPFTTFYRTGNLLSIGVFTDAYPSEIIVFYDNQKPRRQHTRLNKYDKSWASNGKLISYTQIDDSLRNNGIIKSWYNTGELEFEGLYTHDIKSGKWVYYKKNGQILKTEYH